MDDAAVEEDYSTATWLGNSQIIINSNTNWYSAGGTGNTAFHGANLGTFTGTELTMGGQIQTYGDGDADGHVVEMNYSVYPASSSASTWHSQELEWFDYASNNNWFGTEDGTDRPATVDIANLATGSYKLEVYFRQQTGADSWLYETYAVHNYVANFTVGTTLSTSGTLSAFSTIAGTASTAQSFSVTATHLSGNLTVTPPTGYEVSTTDATSGFGNSATLPRDGNNKVTSQTVWVRLKSSASAGTYNGNVTVSGGGTTQVTVALTGSVAAAVPEIDVESSHGFGAMTTGQSQTETVTVNNTGTGPLSISGVTFTGTGNGQFSCSPTTATVAAGGSQNLSVTFAPTVAGSYSVTMNIANNDSDENPKGVTLTATVKPVAPGVTLSGSTAKSITGSVTGIESGATVTLKRYTSSSDASGDTGGEEVFSEVVNATSKSFTDTGLDGCSTYYYRAWQTRNGQTSEGTATAASRATSDVAGPTLEASGATANTITVTWSAADGATGYKVQVASGTPIVENSAGGTSVLFTNAATSTTPPANSGWSYSGLHSASYLIITNSDSSLGYVESPIVDTRNATELIYTCNARTYGAASGNTTTNTLTYSYSDDGGTTWSGWATLGSITRNSTTFVDVSVDATAAAGHAEVKFRWINTGALAGKGIGIRYLRLTATTEVAGNVVAESVTLGANVRSWTTQETLSEGETYYYRVQAIGGGACSAWSSEGSQETSAANTAPAFSPAGNVTDGTATVGHLTLGTYAYSRKASGYPAPTHGVATVSGAGLSVAAAGTYGIEASGNDAGDFWFTPTVAGTYKFRVTASNYYSSSWHTATYDITVAARAGSPTVTDNGLSGSAGVAGATLTASVSAMGAETGVGFKYGTASGSYTGVVAVTGGDGSVATNVAAGTSGLTMTAQPSGLIAGTTYYYQWTATSTGGVVSAAGTASDYFTTACFETVPVVTTNTGSLSATLSWPRMAGADHYLVSVWTNGGGGTTSYTFDEDAQGWSLSTAYFATNCLRLGSGSNGGNATSPTLDLAADSGTATLSFTAWRYGSDTGNSLTVQVSTNGGSTWPEVTGSPFTITATSKGTPTEVTLTGMTATSQLRFSVSGGKSRLHIDDITIAQSGAAYATGTVGGVSQTLEDVRIDQIASGTVTAAITSLAANTNAGYSWSVTAVGGGTCSAKTEGSGLKVEAAPAPRVGVLAGDPLAAVAAGSTDDWGTCEVWAGAVSKTYTVTNAGNATLATLNNATVTGDGFSGGTMGVNANLAAGGTTTFTVTFTPTTNMAAGVTKTGTVSFTHGAAGSPFTFQVTATVPAATISATPNTLDLVGTKGSAGAAKKFKPTGAHLTDEPVRLWFSGTNPTAFQIRGWPTNGTAAWSTYTNYARCWPVNGVVSLATNQVRLVKGLDKGTYSATLMASGGGLSGDVLLVTINGTVYPKPVLAHNSAETSVVPGGTASLDFAAASGITNETCYSYKLTLPEGVTAAQTTFATNNGNLTYNPPASPPPYGTYAFDIAVTNSAGGGANFTWTVHVADAPTLTETVLPETTAVLAGTASAEAEVDAGGASTTVAFEYGTTEAYGTSGTVKQGGVENATVGAAATGAGNEATVTVDLAGLTPGTTYHYRWTVASVGGTNRVTGSFFVPGNGLEFPGGWNSWAQSGTTERDTLFGGGNYYATPALHLTGNHEFKAKKGDDWYARDNKYWLPPNRAQDVGHDKSDMWAGGSENQYLCVTETGGGFTPKGAGYYTLRGYMYVDGGGTKRVQYVAMYTENPPVTVTNGADDSATAGTGDVTVTAELSAAPSASEKVYVRYTTDGWATSALTNMTVSGTNVTGRIPGQGKGTTVEWYILTSPHEYVTNSAANAADLCTLRGLKSGGTNFCYTTAIAAPVPGTATAGYEQVVLSWALNAAGQNVTIVRYDGTPAAGDITQPADGTAYADQATLVTGTTTGTVVYVNWNSTGVTNAAEQGKTYTYVFYSVNGDGAGIKYSEGASATLTATTMALATPTVSSASTAGTVGLSGANAARGEVYVVARTEGSDGFDGNPSGGLPGTGNPLCGGTVVYQGTTAGFNDSVIGCTTYNYKAWLKAADENAWSAGSAVRSMTAAIPGAVAVTGTNVYTDGFALSWTEADRADGYLISIWTGGETTTNTSATYDVVDKKTVTPGGTVPDGATAVFTNTCPNNNDQITAGKHMMLTLGGYAGKTITGLKLRMHSNAKVGAGTLSVTSGSSTLLSFGDTGFGDSTHWSTGYSSEYTVLDFTSQLTATTIAAGQTLVITITGTTNSLFCEQFEVLYETTVAGTDYVSGYGADGGWITNGVAIGGMDPGTDYSYSLWAVGATANCAGPVTTNLVHTDGTAKPNPPGLSLSVTGPDTIAATVTRANGEAWELWRFATAELAAAATEPPAAESSGVVRLGGGATPASGSTTVTDTGLTGCTTYWYRAWEVNDPEGTPLWSNAREANAKTEAPDEPTGLAVTSTNAHGATLAWEAATGAAGYDVEVWHTGMGWGSPKTVTYTFVTNNSAKYTVSGTAPAGSSATYSNHRWVNCVDAGQTNTMTLHGWGGVKITGLSMEMCSWTNAAGEDSGRGSFTMTSGGSTLVNVPDSTFNSTNWYGEWSEATLVTVPMRVTETVVGETANVTLKLIGTEDSLLWEEFTVTYVELEPGGRVYDWENGSGVGGVSVSVAGTNATVSGLTEATGYGWSVASVGGDCEARAEGPDFETTEIVAAPSIGSPLGLWVNGISGTVTGSADADTLWLYRFDDNDHAMSAVLPAAIGGTRVTNVTGGAGTWNFADTNLLGCKTYWYRAWLEDEIDGETYRSPGSTPVSGRTAMAVPEPKGTGAGTQMVISWTNVPGATNYVLQVSDKTNTWTSLGGDSVVFSEEFAGVPTSESSNITATISSYTASNGWVATNAYGSSQGGPKMGASGTAGYLETPTLAGLATNGTATFVMKSYNNTDETKTVMEVKYGSGEWGGAVTNQLTTEWKSYPLALATTGTTFKVRVRAASASKQRFFIDRFEVTEKVASAARGMFFDEVATSPTTIEGLEIGSNYFFRVTANGEECSTTGYGWAPTEDAALLEVYPAKKNFGAVNKGQSVSNKFEVSNRGNIALKFAGVDTAPAGCGFAVTWPTGSALRADIAPGSSREYWVTFTPTNSGGYSGTLRFVCNAANGEATEVATNKLVTVPLTGTGYDPESAEPEVIGFSITDALGTDGTVWDQSLALDDESPVLKVTAWHASGIWTSLLPSTNRATWTLRGPDGAVVTLTNGTALSGQRFTSVRAVPHGEGIDSAEFSAAIPALGAGRAARGPYTLEVTVTDATGRYTTTATNCVPADAHSTLLDDFTRADVVADGTGKLERGWTAIMSGAARASEAAIHDGALELYGELGTSSGAAGRIAVVRDMSDVGYATTLHEFAGSGSWGFHFRSEAQLHAWDGSSMAGAFVLGSTQPGWLSASDGQAGLAVTLTTNGVQLASFTNSLLANVDHPRLTGLGDAWTGNTAGKKLAVRVEFIAGKDAVDEGESDDGQAHDAIPAYLQLYVKEVSGTGGDPTTECDEDDFVTQVEVPEAFTRMDLPYGGVVWAHGSGAAGADNSARFDDIHVPRMSGQSVPLRFWCVDDDTKAPTFDDFDVPAAIAAGTAATAGLSVTGTILDASGLWMDVGGTNAPAWETAAIAAPSWELWVNGTNVASGATTNAPAGNGAGTSVAVSFTIPSGAFDSEWRTTNCVVVVKAWDHDIDRPGDSKEGRAEYRFTLCDSTPTAPAWATVEADGAEMAVVRWAWTNGTSYVVVRGEEEFDEDATPPQGTLTAPTPGLKYAGLGWVAYVGTGDNHLTNGWTAREVLVPPGSSNYFAVYGMTGDGTTGHFFSAPTRTKAYTWATTNEAGETVTHWATEGDAEGGKPAAGSVWSNSWPMATVPYEPGEGIDAFAYRTSVSYPTNKIAETPAQLALTYGYETRTGTGSGWSTNEPTGWQGDTNMWKIHDGSLLTGGTGYPTPAGNKLYWEDTSGESAVKTEAKLTRMLDYPESGDFFVAAILNYQYDGTGKWVTVSMVDESGNDLVSFGKQGGSTDTDAAIYTADTSPFGDHTLTGGTPYELTIGHGNDHIVVGQLSRADRKLRMWCYTGNMKIPEVYSKTAANGTEVGLGVATTALNTVRADWTYAADTTVPEVAGIRMCAGSDGNKALGHVYFDEVRFAATWEELFLFNEPEVETFDLATPAGSGKANGTNDTGMTQWLVSDGALAHGDVGLNATFELYHRTGIQSASFDILSGGKQGQTNLLRAVTNGTTAAEGNRVTNVALQGTSGSVYGEWTTPDGGATGVAIPTNWISLESNYVLQVSMHSSGGREATATSSKDNMGGGASDLFFGEYGEGASWDKYVEIYNGTGHDVDLYNYYIFRPANASAGGNQFTNTYSNLIPNATYPFARLSQTPFVLHHKQTVTLLNDVSQPGHPARLAALKAELDKKRAKYLVMPTNVLDSNGSVPYLLVKAEKFNESDVLTAAAGGSRVNLDWLDACGCAQMVDPSVTERYIMSRKATATHLPRSNPMIIDTNEWDYRRWSYPKGSVDDKDSGYTNFIATAGGYDRAIGLGGTMEFRVYDDDEAPPSLAGGGQGGGLRLKGATEYAASTAGDRTYVMGGWSFTYWEKEWVATNLTAAQCEQIAEMWPSGLTTNGGISWSPLLGESITNVVKGGSGKGQTHVEFDGIEQTGNGALTIKADTNKYVSTAEVWIGFDLDVQDLAEPTVSFGYAGGTSGFSNGYVKVSATGAEGSFEMPNDGWKFTPITGSGSTWQDWSQSLDGVLPEGAGHVWFRVCVKNYKNGSGSCWLDNFRVEGNPRAVRVTDQELADTGVVFEVRVRDESGVDAGAAGTNTSHGATFGAGLGETWYRRAPGTTNIVEGADGAKTTNEYTSIQWTLADGAVEKDGGFGKATAQEWYTKTQDGKGQLKVTVGDLDDDRADDQSVGSKNFGMLVVDDDDDSPPQIRMKTMKPRLDGVVGEWLFKEKSWGATEEMDGVAAGALGVCTTNGTLTKPRASERTAADTGLSFKTYAVYQTGWQAGSKYWTTTLRTTGGGKGKVTSIRFWSKVGSVNSPTGWELWTKTGDEDAWEVTAGSDTNGLLKTGGVTNTCWQKQSDEAAEGLAIGVWREYGIELGGDDEIELPADGTPVEIRLLGKGTAAKGIGASWFLWDLTMEGELEQSTGEGEESYTYKTDHEVASGGGESLTMQGSVWDEASGLAAAPTWEMTQGITGSGTVTFVNEEVAPTNRTSEPDGAFSVALPVSTTYTNLQLKEYKGTITATDADNDRNSAEDGSGTNYDSLTHTGKFGFTVVDQDVTRPTAPSNVTVNGVAVPGTAPDRTDPGVAWTNKPEFVVSFAVAVDQDPSTNWTDTVWTNLNVSGEVVKTNIQSGVSGIGEYRVALADTAAALSNGTPYAVAVTNGAIANYGFERSAGDIGWTLAPTNTIGISTNVAHEGTNSMRIGASTTVAARDVYARQVIVCEMGGATTVTVEGSMWFYQNGSTSRARIYLEAFGDEAMTSALSCSGGLDQSFGSDVGKDTWTQAEVAARTFTAPAGTARVYLRVTLYSSGAANYFDDVRLSVRVGSAPAAGTTDRASMRFVADKAAQGLNAKYLYAVDADNDRKDDRLAGAPAMFYTAYDITPPTAVKFPGHAAGASTDHVDDPTTQFDLTWLTGEVGPDDPAHTNHPTGTGTDLLSPWATYKVYYGVYDPVAAEGYTNETDTARTGAAAYIEDKFIALGSATSYTNWPSRKAGDGIEDPAARLAGITNYTAITNMSASGMRLYDLEFDQEYVVVVVGVDKAGNEGPANAASWATNNTIKFSMTRGWHVPKADAEAAFTNLAGRLTNRVVSALEWTASGTTNIVAPGRYEGEVKKDYDLIRWDARNFRESADNDWQLVQTVRTNWFVDDGGPTKRGDIRFYRASYKDRWKKSVPVAGTTNMVEQTPLVSEEVYAQTGVRLRAGKNFVSLHGVPYTNTLRGVFGGLETFPGGESPSHGATCIHFYDPHTAEPNNGDERFWLDTQGEWRLDNGAQNPPQVGDIQTNRNFFTRAFSIKLPEGFEKNSFGGVTNYYLAGVQTNRHGSKLEEVPYMLWKPIAQVPTNGFSQVIQCGTTNAPKFNLVALRLPVATHPGKMNLTECGFAKGDPWEADWIYTFDTITQEPGHSCYCDADGNWKFVGGGNVPGDYFKPNDVLVIESRIGGEGNSWTWTYKPKDFYTLPNRHMRAE